MIKNKPTEKKVQLVEDELFMVWQALGESRGPVTITDCLQLDNPVIYANQSFLDLTGYSKKEVIGHNCRFLQGPDTDQKTVQKLRIAVAKRQHIRVQIYNYRKNGKPFWNDLILSPVKNKKGIVTHFIGLQIDDTERIEREEVLRKSKESLSKILERQSIMLQATKLGIWYCDLPFDNLVWDNKVKDHFWLYPHEQVTMDMFYKQIHPNDRYRTKVAIEKSIKNNTLYDIEYRTVNQNTQQYKWIRSMGRPTYDNKNQPVRFDGISIEVTDEKTVEQQKDDFIAIASHELKTPVTSIKLYAQTLGVRLKKSQDVVSSALMNKLDTQLDKLVNLIDDLLDVTNMENGKLQLREETFDFTMLVEEIVEAAQLTTAVHTIIQKFSTTSFVFGDRNRVGQVITNFISNAIKYSPHNKKIIITTLKDTQKVTLLVQDFGIGISRKKQEKVFERYYRVEELDHQKNYSSLGLGLYISSEIIKKQGGTVWVTSNIGKGSTFGFSLPVKPEVSKNSVTKRVKKGARR